MHTSDETTKAAETSLTKDALNLTRYYAWSVINRVRPYLRGRRGLILSAVAILGAGTALNWDWLVAVGIAPIILTLAPCAVMCALGLCIKGAGKSCSSDNQNTKDGAAPGVSTNSREED